MQLSASLLPFDLPPAPGAAPLPGVPALTPASDAADFGALLNAQSGPVPPTDSLPVAPGLPTSLAGSGVEPVVELSPTDWPTGEGTSDAGDAAVDVDLSDAVGAGVPAPANPSVSRVVEFAGMPALPVQADDSTGSAESDNEVASSEIDASAPAGVSVEPTTAGEVRRRPGIHDRTSQSSLMGAAIAGSARPDASDTASATSFSRAPVSSSNAPLPGFSPAAATVSSADAPLQPVPTQAASDLPARASTASTTTSAAITSDGRLTVPASTEPKAPQDPAASNAPQLRASVAAANAGAPQAASAMAPDPASSRPSSPVAGFADPITTASRIENVDTTVSASVSAHADATPLPTPRPGPEKFAVSPRRGAAGALSAYKTTEKNTETSGDKLVENQDAFVGTNAAKPELHMPFLAPHAPSAPHAVERLSQAVAPLSFEFSPGEAGGDSVELAQAARRAVNAAVAVSEQFATESKPAVTLKFTVSGVDLGVRVELRGENIHTTFRTDSPELRAALAQEWHAVTAVHPGDRASRLAEPVFTSNPGQSSASATSNSASNPDFTASDQRGSQQRQQQGAAEEWARFRAGARDMDSSDARVAAPVITSRAHPTSAPGRLHTFA